MEVLMPLFKAKSPDDLAHEAAEKEREHLERERKAFLRSPVGMAHSAFERGDLVFQFSIDVMNQSAVIVKMVGSTTTKKTADPVEVLNAICREGWDLITGNFVFVEEGQQSRDKFMSSGQNVAVKGRTVGYYLFKRCETNRQNAGQESIQS
jgi:hypothetical protein